MLSVEIDPDTLLELRRVRAHHWLQYQKHNRYATGLAKMRRTAASHVARESASFHMRCIQALNTVCEGTWAWDDVHLVNNKNKDENESD